MLWFLEGCYLAVCMKSDLQTGFISVKDSLIMALTGIVLRSMEKGAFTACFLVDAIPGAVCMLFARLTGQRLGTGDGWIILATGMLLGVTDTLRFLWITFVIGGCSGAVMMLTGKAKRESVFPLAPCMMAAYLIMLYGKWNASGTLF